MLMTMSLFNPAVDACIPNPCQHGGTCRDENGTATCECKGAWGQPLCKGKVLN